MFAGLSRLTLCCSTPREAMRACAPSGLRDASCPTPHGVPRRLMVRRPLPMMPHSPSGSREPPPVERKSGRHGTLKVGFTPVLAPSPSPSVSKGALPLLVEGTHASEVAAQSTVAVRDPPAVTVNSRQSRQAPVVGTPRKKTPITCGYCGRVVRKDVLARHHRTLACREALVIPWEAIAAKRQRCSP